VNDADMLLRRAQVAGVGFLGLNAALCETYMHFIAQPPLCAAWIVAGVR
jgi:hypothetical protein